ncbi:unnamed protein product [Phytomonas sp. EM1]|nr:unnamed protein product [Phytomonas sp. EM1]|eukprot:CCW63394.1 unnamed protein product [Phytomonas sp. isolate EM1]
MRVREAEVRRGATRLEALARKAKRVDGELAALQRRPVDRMGSSPRRPYQRETSRGSLASRSSSQIPASRSCVSPRLYQTPRHAATTYHYLSKRPARALSVLSDDDLPEKDLKEHANELMQWREERSQLLSEKVRMVQQHKELNFHLRRGTHIKPISAVTPTSARTPIKQLALKSFSAVDADGHNLLARLRLDANRVGIEVTKCRAAHQEAISRVARTRESLESNLEDLKMKRDQWRIRFESVACKMEETIACAKSISAQLVSIRSSDQKYKGIVADRLGIKREDAEGVPGLLSLRNRIEGGKLLVMHTNKVESVLNAALERLRGIYPAPI